MTEAADLIAGDALKAATINFLGETRAKVQGEQKGLLGTFDSWFTRVVKKLIPLDSARSSLQPGDRMGPRRDRCGQHQHG